MTKWYIDRCISYIKLFSNCYTLKEMFQQKLLLVLSICFLAKKSDARSDLVSWIESNKLTNFGDWGPEDLCPDGSYVIGFDLKIEDFQREKDDTALNGISLTCFDLKQNRITKYVTSSVGPWGFYRGRNDFIKGLANGFELKSDPNQGRGDDAGADDFNLISANADGTSSILKGGEILPFGKWATTNKMCPSMTAICGIQTQVEKAQGDGDDTALNNIKLACCKVPHRAETCKFKRGVWEDVMACHSGISNCAVKVKTGITISTDTSVTSTEYNYMSQSLGLNAEASARIMNILNARGEINGEIGKEVFNGKTLKDIISTTEYGEREYSFSVDCVGTAQELVLRCEPFIFRTKEFRCRPDLYEKQ